MITSGTTPDRQADIEPEQGLFARLKARVRGWLSAVDAHCEAVEQSKEACERQNLEKHGKDWVNRCCG
jgi:hypothetical protein